MLNPELYSKYKSDRNNDSTQYVQHYLGKYCNKIKWSDGDKVLDLGCGDGTVTVEVLKPYLPVNYGKLMGCDVSEAMVQHANQHHADKRTSFFVLDATGELPPALKEEFNHVFSFYALHWIRSRPGQLKAFQNIYDLLSENGDCLLVFIKRNTTHDIFRELAKRTAWCELMHDPEKYMIPYHDDLDAVKHVKEMMVDIGFNNVEVKATDDTIHNREKDYKDLIRAICPFKLSDEKLEDFVDDCMQVARDLKRVNTIGGEAIVTLQQSLIVAYGTK